MLKRCDENDFQQLKDNSSSRLNPDNASGGLLAALVYNLVVFIVFFAAILFGESYNFSSMWESQKRRTKRGWKIYL